MHEECSQPSANQNSIGLDPLLLNGPQKDTFLRKIYEYSGMRDYDNAVFRAVPKVVSRRVMGPSVRQKPPTLMGSKKLASLSNALFLPTFVPELRDVMCGKFQFISTYPKHSDSFTLD